MTSLHFRTLRPNSVLPLTEKLIAVNPSQPHVIDMPYRITSSWQDQDCDMGIWVDDGGELKAWALFQPAWWNLDYAICPSVKSDSLEKSLFSWGKTQMENYAQRSGESFWGSVELFADTSNLQGTITLLESLGFQPFTWSTLRFEIDLSLDLPQPKLLEGFRVRPLRSVEEIDAYVHLHRVAFGSDKMTKTWRKRTLGHPVYKPELDLMVENADGHPVGFCIGWFWQGKGQLEPLGVHPDYQGFGLGKALELSGLHALKQLGVHHAYIDHVSLNDKAIALSQQTGFKQCNDALRFYVDVGSWAS